MRNSKGLHELRDKERMPLQSMKSLGAVYTPDSVTTAMCKSVLVEYINSELCTSYPAYMDLILEKDIQKQREILGNLRKISVLDPACGTGHFLLTMLYHLEKIYVTFKKSSSELILRSEAEIREQIILNNLFGVEIDPIAVKTCKLRLFHAIADEYADIEGSTPRSLIDLHIRNGNSVIGIFGKKIPKLAKSTEKSICSLIEDRERLIHQYEGTTGEKSALKYKEIAQKTKKLHFFFTEKLLRKKGFETARRKYSAEDFNEKFNPFHWRMEFSRILGRANSGFDVIIGNPPYVKADSQDETFQQYREIARKLFDTFEEKWDLYIAFLELGLKLLRPGGVLSFIISDSFTTAKYASKMRRLLLSKKLLSVSFYPEIKLFPQVGVHNIVITVRNDFYERNHKTKRITYESVDEPKFIEMVSPIDLGERLFRDKTQLDALFYPQMKNTIPLGEICYISKGMVLNSDEKRYKGEFRKEDLIKPKRSNIHCKLYTENKFIRRFCIFEHRFLEYGTNRMPSRVSRPTFPELYTNSKILVGKMGGRAVYDDLGMFCNDSLIIVIPYYKLVGVENRVLRRKTVANSISRGKTISQEFDLRYLLGIINSSHATSFFNNIRTHRLKDYVNPNELKQLPIYRANYDQQSKIIAIVERLEENRRLKKEMDKDKTHDKPDEAYGKLSTALNKAIEVLYRHSSNTGPIDI
jgi:type I restriction-modification system DNA methylase subunit